MRTLNILDSSSTGFTLGYALRYASTTTPAWFPYLSAARFFISSSLIDSSGASFMLGDCSFRTVPMIMGTLEETSGASGANGWRVTILPSNTGLKPRRGIAPRGGGIPGPPNGGGGLGFFLVAGWGSR